MKASKPVRRVFAAELLVASLSCLTAQTSTASQENIALNGTGRPEIHAASPTTRDGIFRIDVAVTDAAGKPVRDLQATDFRLLDNGKPTRIFTLQNSAAAEAKSEPLPTLIFVFNEDGFPPVLSAFAEKVVANYLRENGGILSQPVSLYRVAHDGLYASAKASINGNALADEIEKRAEPRLVFRAGTKRSSADPTLETGTSIFRTVGVLGLIATDQQKIAGRKTLLWFGSNEVIYAWRWCNFDEPVELSTRLHAARIVVSVVLMGLARGQTRDAEDLFEAAANTSFRKPARLTLPSIALHTGGLVLQSWDDEKRQISEELLRSDIQRCADEARAFYSLTFDPRRTERANEYHRLAVEVSRQDLIARTVAGYFDQPVYWDHPRPNIERLSVTQLENAIRLQAGDSGFPRRLGNMELTERLVHGERTRLLALLKNDREREALTALADLSEFQAPPQSEKLADPHPGPEEETAILKRTFEYAANSIPKLPDFFATRTALSFQAPQVRDKDSCENPATEQPLRVAFTSRGTVQYRGGVELVDAEKSSRKQLLKGRPNALDTRGTFGPVAASVLSAAADQQSTVKWSRWEKYESGKLAIFNFVIPSMVPIFEVTYCCLPQQDGTAVYRTKAAYRGEFAIDPSDGAMMRLAIEADLDEDRDPRAPLVRSAEMMEYGRVEIGGKRYVVPIRSVSVSRGRTLTFMRDWGIPFIVFGPFETLVNDFTFSDHHKFGSESRILGGSEEVLDAPGAGPKESKPR